MAPLSAALNAAMSSWHLVKRFTELPLHELKAWSDKVPFKMDALGLVTLLGADQVSTAIGSLQRRRYTGALPLLAAFFLAGDRFTSIQPGFAAYNLSDGTKSTELSGWFTRWLMCQQVNNAATHFKWMRYEICASWGHLICVAISCSLVMPLVVLTGLMGDWYGVANAGAIIASIAARLYILKQRRQTRDKNMRIQRNLAWEDSAPFFIITRSDGKMITLKMPSPIVLAIFRQAEFKPDRPILYGLAQQAAWVALGIHLLVLGMCTLVTQIYTVILLVSSTVAVSSTANWSADTGSKVFGSTLQHTLGPGITVTLTEVTFNDDWRVAKTVVAPAAIGSGGKATMDMRLVAFARLNLREREERMLKRWKLAPQEEDISWWTEYRTLRDDFASEYRGNADRPSSRSSSIAMQDMRRSSQHSNTPVT